MLATLLEKSQAWAQTASGFDFWFLIAILLTAGGGSAIYALTSIRDKRIIADTPTSKIRSAAQGYVELSGQGQPMEGGQSLVSPLTRTPCIWYQSFVERASGSGSRYGNRYWSTVSDDTSSEPFLINDGTGECVVDPESADVTAEEYIWHGSSARPSRRPNKGRFGKLMDRFGILSLGGYRYTERLIRKNATVYAIGLFKTVGGAGAELDAKADVRDLIREWKENSAALLERFDKNKDGEIDLKEWQQIREEAYKEVLKKHRHEKTLPPVHTIGKTGNKRRPFLLSSLDQAALMRELHFYSISCYLSFALCGAVSVLLLSWRY